MVAKSSKKPEVLIITSGKRSPSVRRKMHQTTDICLTLILGPLSSLRFVISMKHTLVAAAIIQEEIDSVKANLPLLPQQRRQNLLDTYLPAGVTESDIDILLGLDEGREIGYDGRDPPSSPSAVAYFEKLSSSGRNAKAVMNW
jgi:hypothetical protein